MERFWSKVAKSDGCWEWTGSRNPGGYGTLSIDGKSARAHRVAYELVVGPIPDGLVIDHLCRNTGCVNPAHLEAVTHKENTLRGTNPMAQHARQTHCKRGHEFTHQNTYRTANGGRNCRTCSREKEARRYANRVAARYEQSREEVAMDAFAVIFDWWPSTPTYHGFDNERLTPDGSFTRCGRVVSDYTDGRLSTPGTWFPLKHAPKFARPCRMCFPTGARGETE